MQEELQTWAVSGRRISEPRKQRPCGPVGPFPVGTRPARNIIWKHICPVSKQTVEMESIRIDTYRTLLSTRIPRTRCTERPAPCVPACPVSDFLLQTRFRVTTPPTLVPCFHMSEGSLSWPSGKNVVVMYPIILRTENRVCLEKLSSRQAIQHKSRLRGGLKHGIIRGMTKLVSSCNSPVDLDRSCFFQTSAALCTFCLQHGYQRVTHGC